MATTCSRCGCDLDEHGTCRKCSVARYRGRPALVLVLALAGLFLLPLAFVAVVLATRQRKRLEREKLPEDKVVRLGLVLGMTGILLGIIQVCAFLYLLPSILYAPKLPANEAAAISALRKLCQVQTNYRKLTGKYAPSLKLLRERGFIDSDFKELQDYRLELNVSEDLDSYEARAVPLKPGQKHFFVDPTGVLRHSDGADAGPHSPAIGNSPEATHSESP